MKSNSALNVDLKNFLELNLKALSRNAFWTIIVLSINSSISCLSGMWGVRSVYLMFFFDQSIEIFNDFIAMNQLIPYHLYAPQDFHFLIFPYKCVCKKIIGKLWIFFTIHFFCFLNIYHVDYSMLRIETFSL